MCTTVGSQAGALKFQRLHLFFQGDDSLSAITFDSDFETVSATGGQPLIPALAVLPLLMLPKCVHEVIPPEC